MPKHLRAPAAAAALALALAAPLATALPAHADSTGMSALVSEDCTHGRLQLVLDNRTTASQTFTVNWPGVGSWSRTVAAGGNTLLYFTRADGTAYTFTTTTPTGFSNTQSGTTGCTLAAGTPQLDNTTILSTSTVIQGLNGASGSYNGTVASVRIPAMAVTDTGAVLAVADARVSSSGDLPNNIQLALSRSTDNGRTWSAPAIVVHAPTTSEGTGDASLVVDRSAGLNGRVYLFYNYGPAGIGFNSPASGSNSASDTASLHVQYVTSDDNGVTWSSPTDLNPQVKDASWGSLFASSGHGTQLSSGRLVQPIVYRDAAGATHAADIYSDDHGTSWHTGGSAGSGVNESKAIERSTGTVSQDMRSNSGAARWRADSTDGGRTFAAASATALVDPGCNADQVSYLKPTDVDPTTGDPQRTATALFSNNPSTSARANLTVRLSTDDGATWPNSALLVPGTAGYSTEAVLGDGSVGDLYEVGSTGGIFFDRFTLGWIQNS
ncbi:exo-alpha-sialidase [Kitasatospora sp. NPDC058965]|uniref:sialidase family protein n=1 Tax=Kitasatospora sp. NPDC058965 TaxID=3346682 RepID=UPI00369EFD08